MKTKKVDPQRSAVAWQMALMITLLGCAGTWLSITTTSAADDAAQDQSKETASAEVDSDTSSDVQSEPAGETTSGLEKALERSLRGGFEEEDEATAAAEQESATSEDAEGKPAADEQRSAKPAMLKKKRHGLDWLDSLAAGQRTAQLNDEPLLVLCGSASCIWCAKLEKELAKESIQKELDRWTLVYIDVERTPTVAQQLAVSGVPALRLLTPRGTKVATHDGYMTAADLKTWLVENHDTANSDPEEVLYSPEVPDEKQIGKLLEYLTNRDVATREAAIRRLAAHRSVTADAVVGTFVEGKLAARLSTLEVLSVWEAPVEELDPWRPETLTEERLARLDKWSGELPQEQAETKQDTPLAGQRLLDAQQAIDQLLAASETEALVMYRRLARHQAALLPEVYARLQASETDLASQRLTALRYHLVASSRRILNWQQGLIALASADVATRRAAADQLVKQAAAEDETLLLELFAHADSLVRELSLRGLQEIGGAQSTKSLVKLLEDPEPNVRAAVLKQLTEKPSSSMVEPVAKYLETETDADLVVHAVRFLRETKSSVATESLLTLAEHDSWQVRAEVAEGLSSVSSSRSRSALMVDVYKALSKLLDDEDGFVVSRAMKGVQSGDTAPIDALVGIVDRHPQLASDAIEMMTGSSNSLSEAVPHLRRLTEHEEGSVRSAALAGLSDASVADMQKEVLAGLNDENSQVRQTAARIVFQKHEAARTTQVQMIRNRGVGAYDGTVFPAEEISSPKQSPASMLLDFFVSGAKAKLAAEEAAAKATISEPASEEQADAKQERGEKANAAPSDAVPSDSAPSDAVPATAEPADTESVTAKPAEAEPAVAPATIEATAEAATREPKAPAGAAPDSVQKSSGPPRSPIAVWVDQYRRGQHREKWLDETIQPLEKMLTAEDVKERAWAAVALIPFGQHDQQAVEILSQAARDHPDLAATYSSVMPWLPWKLRIEFFELLTTLPVEGYVLGYLAGHLVETPEPGAMDEIWNLFTHQDMNNSAADSLIDRLKENYFGDTYFSSSSVTPAMRKRVSQDSEKYLASENDWQRTAAMIMLINVDQEKTSQAAKAIFADENNSPQLRDDALRILLVSQPEPQQTKVAVEALQTGDILMERTALTLLSQGAGAIHRVRGYISLNYSGGHVSYSYGYSDTPKLIVPKAPAGLTAEQVRPFLNSTDATNAAYAGYLLTLLDEPSGLAPLIAQWRENTSIYGIWPRLVYRAVAHTNDSEYVPVLEEIYESYSESGSSYRTKEYYWTIRIMTGPEILRLRKRIRAEVGMSNLR